MSFDMCACTERPAKLKTHSRLEKDLLEFFPISCLVRVRNLSLGSAPRPRPWPMVYCMNVLNDISTQALALNKALNQLSGG